MKPGLAEIVGPGLSETETNPLVIFANPTCPTMVRVNPEFVQLGHPSKSEILLAEDQRDSRRASGEIHQDNEVHETGIYRLRDFLLVRRVLRQGAIDHLKRNIGKTTGEQPAPLGRQ